VPFAGIVHTGNSARVDCVLQALYHLPAFRRLVYDVRDAGGVLLEVQRLFGGLQSSSRLCGCLRARSRR